MSLYVIEDSDVLLWSLAVLLESVSHVGCDHLRRSLDSSNKFDALPGDRDLSAQHCFVRCQSVFHGF